MAADTITAIKKALEELRQPKSMSIYTTQNDMISDLMKDRRLAVEALESLQRENERLNAELKREAELATHMANDCNDEQARAEIAESEVKRLRELLKPFADLAPAYDPTEDDDDVRCWHAESTPTLGDLRRARTALASTGGEHHAE